MTEILCPCCKQNYYEPCDFDGCDDPAEIEAWFGSGLIQRRRVCIGHAKLSKGYTPKKLEAIMSIVEDAAAGCE